MKLLSLFSGIGAFEKALENLDIEYELVGFSEIDEWAIESYSAIHNVPINLNLGDISKVKNEDVPTADLVTYGFPCQDISTAGTQEGIKEGTRSGLLYEAERIINHIKPKYAIAENVKNLIGKTHKTDFNKLLERLEGYGYNNYWEVLNAKDYGIPQNRERVFIVSIRKDIDDGKFNFPKGVSCTTSVKDFVDMTIKNRPYNKTLLPFFKDEFYKKYTSSNGIKKVFDGNTQGYFKSDYTGKRIFSVEGNSPTLTTRNVHHFLELGGKLTPKESLLLMGFSEEDYEKITHIRETELYKQAGNSIVVNVLEEIFKSLFQNYVVKCPKCSHFLKPSYIDGYNSYCPECNEDFGYEWIDIK